MTLNTGDRFGSKDQNYPEAICAGHICLDLIPTLLDSNFQFSPGKLVEAGAVVTSTGGSVSNTGICLSRLGIRSRLLGKVGDDLFAAAVRRILDNYGDGLSEGLIVSPQEQTSYSIILSPPGTDRMFLHAPGCNATFNEDDIDYSQLHFSRLFHFGYPPLMERTFAHDGKTLEAIFQRAKSTGITTSLDMSFPDMNGPAGKADWSAILTRTLPFVDIFTPSIEEILLLLKPDIYRSTMMTVEAGALDNIITPKILETLGSELLDLGVKIVVIKLGDRGLYLRTAAENQLSKLGIAGAQNCSGWADRELWAPCFAVDVVGATGSGDATIAGFLMGLLRNMPVENCMTSACAVGASCVEAADSLSGVRTWQETSERITAGWPRRKFPIDERGWGWMETEAVWRGPNDQRSA